MASPAPTPSKTTPNPTMSEHEDSGSESDGPQQHPPVQQQQQNNENSIQQQKKETGLQSNRSRSASRRARRSRIKQAIEDGKYMKTSSLEALEEADANGELDQMQVFERIGPDSTSMDGPVTKARAMRGEIPNQPYTMSQDAGKKSLDQQDGLKLRIEANLEIEIELKASIRGDLTLSLLE